MDNGNWPLIVRAHGLTDAVTTEISINPGITTLVGPNGSGKTRALRSIQAALASSGRMDEVGRKIRFLAAGRSSPLEGYRADLNGPGARSRGPLSVGHYDYRASWSSIESVIGDLFALEQRPDLKLKVEARLQQLLDRSVELAWTQSGLSVTMVPLKGTGSYTGSEEASGILQLIPLLTAIHNDEIGALIIDEPEISLHPQHQAFLLEEIEKVAGDPRDPEKKLVILATHSASMLPLRAADDLPAFIFFRSAHHNAVQIPSDTGVLKAKEVSSLLSRLSSTHRMATFAERILMVEGPSDEIVINQLARRAEMRLLARNAQVLPVGGKAEFIAAAKLFRTMGKETAVLADLDALSDDNGLVNYFSTIPDAAVVASKLGHESIVKLDGQLRTELGSFMRRHTGAIASAAEKYPDWSSNDTSADSLSRVTLARLLTDPASFGANLEKDAAHLAQRYSVLLEMLGQLGCFFLRRGAIENYYDFPKGDKSKPDAAVHEVAAFRQLPFAELETRYRDVYRAAQYIAPDQRVDEDVILRPKLGAALAAAFQVMEINTSDADLQTIARTAISADASLFRFTNASTAGLRIKVEMASRLFPRNSFPFEISVDENLTSAVKDRLPGVRTS